MAEIALALGQSVQGNPGDTFKFVSTSSGVSYRFAVTPVTGTRTIGMWKNIVAKGNGVARNKAGVDYVDHKAGTGTFIITVAGDTMPYSITASKTPGFFNWISGLF